MATMNNQTPSDCCLCQEICSRAFPRQYQAVYSVTSRFCVEAGGFVALPTLSPLVAGHVLVLPRRHVPNLAVLSEPLRNDLLACVESVSTRLAERFGPELYFFEHGVTVAGQGCGIDHAHLHVLPLRAGTTAAVDARVEGDFPTRHEGSLVDVLSFVSQRGASSYLLHGQSLEKVKVAVSGAIQSQYMRRLVARMLNLPDWDWKKLSAQTEFHSTLGAFGAF